MVSNVDDCYIFVYGSLMRGYVNHRVIEPYGTFMGTATMFGLQMLDIGFFPGVIKSEPAQIVHGEVYRLHEVETGLRYLDELEEHPIIYRREQGQAHLTDGTTIEAWVYLWLQGSDFTVISSGDYRAYHPPLRRDEP